MPAPSEHCVGHCHRHSGAFGLCSSDFWHQLTSPTDLEGWNYFPEPLHLPCLAPGTPPDASYPPTFTTDLQARKHTCRLVPLRQFALLSSSVRREVREALEPEASPPPPPCCPPLPPRSSCDGSLLRTYGSPPQQIVGTQGPPRAGMGPHLPRKEPRTLKPTDAQL